MLSVRQWWYQTCTEFGWYQVSAASNPAFGDRMPIDYFLNLCKDLYGEAVNKTFIESQIKGTNTYYGGTNIDISRIVYLHGSLDPWHPVGLYESNKSEKYSVIFIKGWYMQARWDRFFTLFIYFLFNELGLKKKFISVFLLATNFRMAKKSKGP